MLLKELAHADCCMVVQGSPSRDELFERMVGLLAGSGRLPVDDVWTVLVELAKREEAASTAFGLGVAIPHCFLKGVGGPHLAVACLPQGMRFDAAGDALTYVVFLLVEDLADRGAHTALISRIARLCRESAVLERLREAREPASIPAILAEEEAALD